MLHTHTLVVSLYLLQLIVKAVLLTTGKHETLDKFSSKTRYPHIVLATLMLVTGIFLMARSPEAFQPYIFVKLALVFGSIPLGIVGFKKRNNVLGILSVVFMGTAMTLAFAKPAFLRSGVETEVSTLTETGTEDAVLASGKVVYETKCGRCHGPNGDSGFQGAKNLKASTLTDAEIKTLIREGKGMMPADKDLTDDQIAHVTAFVKQFRK